MFVTPSCHVRYPFLSCSLPLPARLVLTVIEHQEDGLGTEEVGCNKHQNLHHVLTIIGGKWLVTSTMLVTPTILVSPSCHVSIPSLC